MAPTIFFHISTSFCYDSKLHYIIRAEYHTENIFAIKFYCKKDKRSDFKYNKIINKHNSSTVLKILNTCLSVVPMLLQLSPNCNFALLSSRSVDFSSSKRLTEGLPQNQRFRIYSRLPLKITFSSKDLRKIHSNTGGFFIRQLAKL
jgi:hypothetical protein